MAQLRLSPTAARDLDQIADDIAAVAGARVALGFIGAMRQSLEALTEYPRMGRMRRGFGAGVRLGAAS